MLVTLTPFADELHVSQSSGAVTRSNLPTPNVSRILRGTRSRAILSPDGHNSWVQIRQFENGLTPSVGDRPE